MNVNKQFFIKDIINEFLRESNEENMDVLIQCAENDRFSDEDILTLANGLAQSGEVLNLKQAPLTLSDIPSTGGPSSLSTLLCPLFLVYFNNAVIKLGVAGRPAGGIDVLYQIRGYNISPTQLQVKEWIQSCRFVHFIANEKFAPLDARLFAYRKKKNSIDVPALVIASLLSKKIAVGISTLGLDIRVSKFGNFGKSWNESKINGLRFNRVAALAGIKSKCFLTNGDQPQQNYIGRGEALLALHKIFNNSADNILHKHYSQCLSMAFSIGNNRSHDFPSTLDIKNIFFENINTQQGVAASFFDIVTKVEKGHIYELCAKENGFLQIDIYAIRDAIVEMNASLAGNMFPDNCGVILKQSSNDYVRRGQVICTYRSIDSQKTTFHGKILKAFCILPLQQNSNDFEEVL